MAATAENLVWIDCEMTGLDPVADALVEIAVLVTDSELNVLGEGVDVVIKPPQEALEQMVPFVRDMHTTSGLLEKLDDGVSLAEASDICMAYITDHCPQPGKAVLAGNSVGQDKLFLTRDMPAITDHLHYRIVDVSTLKELSRRWYPKAYFQSPAKTGGHRALGDIIDSINELRYYRAAVMVDAPGPDSKTAQQIASQLELVTAPQG
ncbi:oligoribonuclease [Citricoccus sp. GCM10030269]|uniref:oligoribonuclease n=1 Tax=Citricoccus sp. GCM10030269 TaxID=3273388 RepID=UPI00360AB8E4